MKRELTQNWWLFVLVIISIVLIIIGFLLINSFTLFQKNQTTETYVDPETGNESSYDPSYFTEEDIRKIREDYGDEEHAEGHREETTGEGAVEETETIPEPE